MKQVRNFLLAIFVVILIATVWVNLARAYTFDGDIDPVQFFSYIMTEKPEQISPYVFIISLRSETLSPMFVVNCVMFAKGNAIIIAYAYWDKDLKHFLLTKGHYLETPPDERTRTMLMHKLQRLREMWGT